MAEGDTLPADTARSKGTAPEAEPASPGEAHEHDEPDASAPALVVRGFTDITFNAEDEPEGGKASTGFSLGQFDLFITSALSDKLSVLSEVVYEFEDDNEAVLDVERVQLKYTPADVFNVRVGRMHTPLGYWNQTFHHGTWFQTTADRPAMYLFEDDGGILPVHSVGVEVSGLRRLEAAALEYNVSLLNGRGRDRTEVQMVSDRTSSKAINVWAGISPTAVPGLKFGGNVYLDDIPADERDPARAESLDERILGGYVVYLPPGTELLGELSHIRHREHQSERVFDTTAFYLQGSRRFARWTPYYRFDFVDVDPADPFFAPDSKDLRRHTLGLRWDATTWAALKAEVRLRTRTDADDEGAMTLQSAFTF